MEQVRVDKRALLITGTIVPNSNFVAHTNASQRRDEYYASLLFYADNFKNDDLFFLENSSMMGPVSGGFSVSLED